MSSIGKSSLTSRISLIRSKNEPLSKVSLRGSTILFSVNRLEAESRAIPSNHIDSTRFAQELEKSGDSITKAASSFPRPTGFSSILRY